MGFFKLFQDKNWRSLSLPRGTAMTVPEAQRFLYGMAHRAGTHGWSQETRTIAAYKRRETREQILQHDDPGGNPWAGLQGPNRGIPIGKPGMIRKPGEGTPGTARGFMQFGRWIAIRTERQGRRAAANEMNAVIGRPAIYDPERMRGRKKGVLFRALTEYKAVGQVHMSGKYHLEFGLTPGYARWAAVHQWGGSYNGGQVRQRMLLGWNDHDMRFITETFELGLMKRAANPRHYGLLA